MQQQCDMSVCTPVVRPPTVMPKRWLTDSIELVYTPPALTLAYLSSRASRGTLTWSNQIWPLSTPFSPILGPLSRILTPGVSWLLLSRRRTTKTWGPCHLPSTVSWAKTVHICSQHSHGFAPVCCSEETTGQVSLCIRQASLTNCCRRSESMPSSWTLLHLKSRSAW